MKRLFVVVNVVVVNVVQLPDRSRSSRRDDSKKKKKK